MRAIHRASLNTLTLTTSDRFFADPANATRILKAAEELQSLTEGLKKLQAPADNDPSTRILVDLLADHTQRAVRELRSKHRAYARNLLNSVPVFCVACHTRTPLGPDFSKLGVPAPAPLASMTDIENARFLVATRQYGVAMKKYDEILHAIPEEDATTGEWKTAVYGALALAVRVESDPEKASEIVEHVLDRGFIPRTLRVDALRWRRTIGEWLKEAKTRETTPEAQLAKIKELYDRARELQIAPKDRGADIVYMRISALGHDFLNRYPNHQLSARALFYLGVSYEVLQVWDLWNFHEVIYERCVRQFPGTEAARDCLQRFESSIADDYVGEKIPAPLKARMKELEGLADKK